MGNKLDYKDFSHRKDAKNAKNNILHWRKNRHCQIVQSSANLNPPETGDFFIKSASADSMIRFLASFAPLR
jgi:hypothetical protein